MTNEASQGPLPLRADLHIHTMASDGRWSPEQVVTEAAARSIGLIAIADHDTTANVDSAALAAREAGVAFLRGVEVSSRLDGHLHHILAYGFDPEAPGLVKVLRDNMAIWSEHNDAVIWGLIAAGYPIEWPDYEAYEYERARGGWKPLRFLMDRGLCAGIDDYFDRLLSGLSLPDTQFAHPADVIDAIREAGGLAILAHPGASLGNGWGRETALRILLDLGIAGLECYSQYHDRTATGDFLEWCRQHDLLVTGGSDSHGGFVGRELGVPVVDTSDLNLGQLAERIES